MYCRLQLSRSDEAALRELTVLTDAAGNLLKLVGSVWVDRNNALHPENPYYILKGGCPAR